MFGSASRPPYCNIANSAQGIWVRRVYTTNKISLIIHYNDKTTCNYYTLPGMEHLTCLHLILQHTVGNTCFVDLSSSFDKYWGV